MSRILVVNNDNDTMSLLQRWLGKKSYTVKFTSNAEEVPQLIKKFEPKLLIIDVLQKDVVREVKKNKKTAKIPVILMTGYATPPHMNVQTDEVIEKPFNLLLLEKKIEKLIL